MLDYRKEYLRCCQDKTRIYFIEHYLRTFNADERKEVPFTLFPRQRAYLKSLVEHTNTIAIKHRQAGITTVSSAWITGQIVFANKRSPETILCLGNKLDISEQLVEKIGNFLDQVPRWMWGGDFYSPDPDSPKNTKSIYKLRNKQRFELFNGCKVYARSSGENSARGISSVSILILDEASFIQNGPAVYSQAVAATASVKDAKIIMVSTPNGKDQLYYRTYSQALEKKNNYNAVEFKWFQDLRYNRNLKWYKKNEETGEMEWDIDTVIGPRGEIVYDEERWRALERKGWKPTSPWYVEMCKSFNNDEQKIAQELDVSFLGSSDNVIPVEVIEAHRTQNVIELPEDWHLRDPLIKETWIWKEPIEGHRYICACDPSSGASNDRTAIEIIDVDAIDENGKPFYDQVLEYYGKMTGDEIGEMIYAYASAYNNALVVTECIGGYGDTIVLTLINKGYSNLYYDDPGLKTYTVQQEYAKFGNRPDGKLPGFRTNSVRVQMISNFSELLKANAFRIRSVRVMNELDTWIWKNGRANHMDGCNDDSLTCLSMGLFVMEYSMLKHDKDKFKDTMMVKGWFVNNNTNTQIYKPMANENINMSTNTYSKKYNPFIANTDSQKNHIKGCLMLGGFINKK